MQQPWGPQHGRRVSEPLRLLAKVPIRECGEPIIRVEPKSSRLILQCKFPYVRARLVGMLEHGARLLPEGWQLLVTTAYRPREEQRKAYEILLAKLKAEHPQWPPSVLKRQLNRFLAPVEGKVPAPHCTGGAVDVRPLGPDGQELDMISPSQTELAVSRTDSPKLSPAARRNREMLWKAMTAAGFTNYRGEWWHWSFGDSGWALRLGKPYAIYGLVDLEGLTPEPVPERKRRW